MGERVGVRVRRGERSSGEGRRGPCSSSLHWLPAH